MKIELSTEAKAARAEYARRWRKANPEKTRANTARYWERKAEKMKDENK